MVQPYLTISGHGWRVGALQIGGRASDGSITLACWHPRGSATWHWSVSLMRRVFPWSAMSDNWFAALGGHPFGQWFDYWRLPFGWMLLVGRQDYHRQLEEAATIARRFVADPPFDAPDEFAAAFEDAAHRRTKQEKPQ